MLKNFLKDNIESRNPATRISAIAALDAQSPDAQEKLATIAQGDSDLSVRQAAIQKVTDSLALAQLMTATGVESGVVQSATERLTALLAEPDLCPVDSVKKLVVQHPVEMPVLVACYCTHDAARDDVLGLLDSQQDLAKVTVESRFHATRQAAAERLTEEPLMESCASAIKTRDKVVAKLLQEKLDASRAAARLIVEHQDEITHVVSAMKSLADSVWSPQYTGRFTALSERWAKLNPPPSLAQQEAYSPAHKQAEEKVEAFRNQQQAQQYCTQASQQLKDLTEELKLVSMTDLENAMGRLRQQSVDINGAWRVSIAAAEPDKPTVTTFEQRRQVVLQMMQQADAVLAVSKDTDAIEKLPVAELKKKIKALSVVIGDDPVGEDKTPVIDEYQFKTDAYALRRKLVSQQKQQLNEDEAKVKSIQKQLGGLAAAISGGKWSPANSLYARVEKKMTRLDDSREKQILTDKLRAQKLKLDELADWHDFASKPKLEAMCEKMEGLPEEKLSPTDQAARIKELQEEWKSIGPSRCANELWPRFKTAGDKAFEPVGEFYSQKREERDSRISNKKLICERLSAFLENQDWDTADWKNVEKILRTAKNEWRENRVTDRKPDKALEQSFTELVNGFNEHLNGQYDSNAAIKQELIERVAKLASGDINQHAVNQTKRLQNSWKQTGIMRRRQTQELWETFNGHCREIYRQHRDTERQKSESGLEHVRKARELVKSIKALCKANDPDEKSFAQMQEEFNALAEFPEKDKKFLFRDFNQASEQFNRLREQSAGRAAKAELVELNRRSVLCDRYEKLAADVSVTDQQQLDDLEAEWEDTTVVLPKKWLSMINKRKTRVLEHIKTGKSFDFTEGDRARRMACIQAEIVSGKETPAEDKSLRMAYQLEQLQQGINAGGLVDTAEQLQTLSVEWMSLPPAHPDDRDQLESRFQAAVVRQKT